MLPHLFLTAVSLLNIVVAFPWMHPDYEGPKPKDCKWTPDHADIVNKRDAQEEKRLLGLIDVPDALTGVGGLLDGLLGGVAQNIQGSNKVPDADHP